MVDQGETARITTRPTIADCRAKSTFEPQRHEGRKGDGRSDLRDAEFGYSMRAWIALEAV